MGLPSARRSKPEQSEMSLLARCTQLLPASRRGASSSPESLKHPQNVQAIGASTTRCGPQVQQLCTGAYSAVQSMADGLIPELIALAAQATASNR